MRDGGKVEIPIATDDDPDWRSDEEASRRRDKALAKLLKMPPKPEERLKRSKPGTKQRRDAGDDRHDPRTGVADG